MYRREVVTPATTVLNPGARCGSKHATPLRRPRSSRRLLVDLVRVEMHVAGFEIIMQKNLERAKLASSPPDDNPDLKPWESCTALQIAEH